MRPVALPEAYLPLLARVDKPGRYVGGEAHAVWKDPARLRATIALAFPDVYDLGMSYHGFRILYERINAREGFLAERVYTPWPDYADALRQARLPLYMLETYRPLALADVVGFTLQHEMNLTNVLEILDLAGIPIRAAERAEADPIAIAGGEGAWSPETMAPFIDAFVVGDGEEAAIEIIEAVALGRERAIAREAILESLAAIPGVYVPAFYRPEYNAEGVLVRIAPDRPGVPEAVRPRLYDISRDLGPVRPLSPAIRTVQDRAVVEVRRGCVNGCRFCQAGMISRPVRERPAEQVVEAARQTLANTGDSALSLLSLSTADYSEILPLVRRLSAEFGDRGISVSLPSLRIASFDVELAAEISSVRKSGFTFAPEAGSEALRRRINKPLEEAAFLDIVEQVARAGWKTVKMYFMLGLPGETDEDLDGIAQLVRAAQDRVRAAGMGRLDVNVTLSPFVPKAHTPFQWEAQTDLDEIKRRMNYVRDRLPRRGVSVKTSPLAASRLEAVLARGDRRLALAVEAAWKLGCRFDAWSELFRPDLWEQAFAQTEIDPQWYACRLRGDDEALPWDHILSGPGRAFLARQRDLARQSETTPECQRGPCAGCEACGMPKEHRLASDNTQDAPPPPERVPKPLRSDAPPVQRLRLRFTKLGPLRFVSHLDLAEAVHRILRRTDAPLAHSQGFNPQPRVSLAPPLPLGFEAEGELADVLMQERIDPAKWLRSLRAIEGPEGLEWTGIEEVGLKAPSLQQAIERYDYRVRWPDGAVDFETVRAAVENFLAAATWPIEIVRKKGRQTRDARHFVAEMRCLPAHGRHSNIQGTSLGMVMRSENGTTLSPMVVLEALLGAQACLAAEIARRPIEVQSTPQS